jgi:Tol biopolymer transport system component
VAGLRHREGCFVIGRTLSHYRITSALGAGGMGEVYRATDTTLGRDVAIKVLPPGLAEDAERLARFEREARLLASLNHPNIAQVYGFESATLPDGSTGHFLAMELVEGEDLAERLKRGPVPVDEASALAKQVAEALEEAHEKGIVHRDLKPGNIKVSPDGKVKVLDFGLAKAYGGEAGSGSSADLSQSPTLARTGTQAGVILGTAAYMSPEQARGKSVDKRTDIWSFGVVLWEMLTGQRLFGGETVSDVLAAVLMREPDWEAFPPETPTGVMRLLRRCLERDPRRRLHDIADARILLEDAISGAPGDVPVASLAGGTKASFREKRLLAALAVALAVGLALGIAAQRARQPAASAGGKGWRFSVDVGPGLYLDRPSDPLVALSPDGSLLAYGVYGGFYPQELRLRRMGEIEASPLAGTRRAKNPFFSPDGQWLAYFSFPDQRLLKVPVAGGNPVEICAARFFWGGTWDARGNIFFGSLGSIYRVSSAGGKPEVVLEGSIARGKPGYRYPEVLPEGDALLVTVGSEGDDYSNASIVLFDLETRKLRTLVDRGENARYVPTGHLVFVRDGSLMAARFDLRRREVQGTPSQVVAEITHAPRYASGHYSFSNNGVLAYVPPGTSIPTARVVWRRRDGSTEPIGLSVSNLLSMRLSPDAAHLAISGSGTSGKLFVFDLQRGVLAPVTSMNTDASTFELQPVWTPDGQRISFSTAAGDNFVFQINQARADGSGPVEPLQKGETETNAYPYAWTPDGRALLYVVETLDKGMNIGILTPGEHPESKLLLSSEANEDEPALSPDGRWLAYTSDESGRREVVVRPFPDLGAKWQVSSEGGFSPRWSRNGREVFYRDGTHVMVVAVEAGKGFAAGRPRPLFKDSIPRWLNGGYDVSPDGQSLLTMEIEEDGAKRIVVVLDWFEELKRLVPTSR